MKKTMKKVIFILLLLTVSVYALFLTYLHFFVPGGKDLSGEWTGGLDMTKQAAVTAFGWLQEVEAVSVSLEDMESYMQDLTIQVNLTLEQTVRSGGTFRCHVLPESYDACRQAAYEAFARAFREILAERLRMAGHEENTDMEDIENLVTETFGMSTVSYLKSCGPALLYDAAGGILTRQFDNAPSVTKTEGYIRKGSSLILFEKTDSDTSGHSSDDYPVIYTLKHSSNQ